jgi:hypothetical protein
MPFVKLGISAHPDIEHVALPFRKNYADDIDTKLEGLTVVTWRKIRDEAPERSGNLKRSIVWKRRGKLRYDILVDRKMKGGKYEHYVRLGTSGPYTIVAVRKRALWWPGLPHPVKAVYNHPGIKANPYWERGLRSAEADFDRAEKLIGTEIEQKLTDSR